jgi:hypothetical protein
VYRGLGTSENPVPANCAEFTVSDSPTLGD